MHNSADAMTLAEKIVARTAGLPRVAPGDLVTCRVDLAMMHDSSGPRRQEELLASLGATIWDADKVVVITDHYVTETDPHSIAIQQLTRRWVAKNGVRGFHDRQGICHVVLPQEGYVSPGMFLVGADSHSLTAGAFGCFAIGVGVTDMTGVLATGEIWIRVPENLRINVTGTFAQGVCAKDMILWICGHIGINGADYKAVEFSGECIDSLRMDERMVLTNMSAELGAKAALIATDTSTREWLRRRGVEEAQAHYWQSDAQASVQSELSLRADDLEPQVAAPYSPQNSLPVFEHAGTKINVAYIGACTGGKLEDLRMAASVLRGHKVSSQVRLLVAPASQHIARLAAEEGVMHILEQAGARFLPSACGGCIGLGPARLADGHVSISNSSRNFRGRMGAATSRTYLGSAYTVAASALAGVIVDPHDRL